MIICLGALAPYVYILRRPRRMLICLMLRRPRRMFTCLGVLAVCLHVYIILYTLSFLRMRSPTGKVPISPFLRDFLSSSFSLRSVLIATR